MADLNLPEGVPIPRWFRRYLEAKANDAGPENTPTPPPVPEVPPSPPQRPQADFAKICKDFKAMGGKNFVGTETYVEGRNWLRETEDLFAIFEVEDLGKFCWQYGY